MKILCYAEHLGDEKNTNKQLWANIKANENNTYIYSDKLLHFSYVLSIGDHSPPQEPGRYP